MNYNTNRILAKDQLRNNNTRQTGLNNNDLIIGPSGSGKTRYYVKPNIMQCNESMIIADAKGSLLSEVGPLLKKKGYKVMNIDFTNLSDSYGYNPLDYIRYRAEDETYVEQDIMTVATAIVPLESDKDPFWELSARMYLACLISYVLECLPEEEHTLEYAVELFGEMDTGVLKQLMWQLKSEKPDSYAVKKYNMFSGNEKAEKMHESIRGILAEKLDTLVFREALNLYKKKERIQFADLGKRKTAVFLTISDTDRSMDRLVNLFYTQALQNLCNSADRDYKDHRLPVPVRLILDDFATNAIIPDFDKTISNIRSREIYVSLILQSISQLEHMYGHDKAMTIINNCDNCLYLGGQDVETARYIGIKADKPESIILQMPLHRAYLFTRGEAPKIVEKYNIVEHPFYKELPEARKDFQEEYTL